MDGMTSPFRVIQICVYIYIYYVYNVYTFIYRLNSHWAKENFGPDHFNWQIFR